MSASATPEANERAAFRIKAINPIWFKDFKQFESNEWALGIAKLVMTMAAKAGRKGFTNETVKYYSKVTITKINVVLEILCEYKFLVAKNDRARFWICEAAFALPAGVKPPAWSMPTGWDERRWEDAPKSIRELYEEGWRALADPNLVAGDLVPTPDDSTPTRYAPAARRKADKHGATAPTTEELTGMEGLAGEKPERDLPQTAPVPLAELEALADAFAAEVVEESRKDRVDPASLPSMEDVAGDRIEDGDAEAEPLAPVATPRARRVGVTPDAGGEFEVTEPKRTKATKAGDAGAKGGKAKAEKDAKKDVGPPRVFVVLDPMVPAAFSGELDNHGALDKLDEKLREFADEPWTVIESAIKETNGNERAAVAIVAQRIQALSRVVMQYCPPEKAREWAEHFSALREQQTAGSGKKTDYRTANATIRFIMRFMTRFNVPLTEIATSMREVMESRAARDNARLQAEIDRLKGELEIMRAATR